MKKLIALALVIGFSAALAASAGAAEMRGLWVDAFHPGFKNPQETSAMISKAKECNFNALFVQVRKRGDVYYSSGIEPVAKDVAGGYDALVDIVTKAHEAGLEVHAWISVYEVYHDTKWTKTDPSHVHLVRPEWLMKDDRGREKFPGDKVFLDPGVPQVQAYLADIVAEIVSEYDVDGIHLDIARYPSRAAGYNEVSVARFNRETGRSGKPDEDDEAWCNWRRDQVTRFVRKAYQKATGIKPQVKVSAAVSANRQGANRHRFQDWEAWLRAGILDFAVPVNFASDNRVFQARCVEMAELATGRPIYMGQGGFKMGAARGVEQVGMVRQAGLAGVVVFSYHYCSAPRKGSSSSLMDELKSSLFSQAAAVPAIGGK